MSSEGEKGWARWGKQAVEQDRDGCPHPLYNSGVRFWLWCSWLHPALFPPLPCSKAPNTAAALVFLREVRGSGGRLHTSQAGGRGANFIWSSTSLPSSSTKAPVPASR